MQNGEKQEREFAEIEELMTVPLPQNLKKIEVNYYDDGLLFHTITLYGEGEPLRIEKTIS
jgi:hypothetical protein